MVENIFQISADKSSKPAALFLFLYLRCDLYGPFLRKTVPHISGLQFNFMYQSTFAFLVKQLI